MTLPGPARACVLAAVVLALAPTARAATVTVNTTTDGPPSGTACMGAAGDCSLRQATSAAPLDATIVVPAGHYVLDKERGSINTINHNVTYQGAGTRSTIIDGDGQVGVFHVAFRDQVTFNDLTVTGGSATPIGGGINSEGDITLNRVAVVANKATSGGGGISSYGDGTVSLTIRNSTISNNAVSAAGSYFLRGGGGILNGPSSRLVMVNSTVASNTSATGSGGGIADGGSTSARSTGRATTLPAASLFNVTVAGNQATGALSGGNLFSNSGLPISLRGSIVAAGAAASGANCSGLTKSGGFNLASDATCALTDTGDQQGVDPQLQAVGAAGGPTDTLRPAQTSPAVEGGDPAGCQDELGAALAADQRSVARPKGARCDIGAVELAPPSASADNAASGVTTDSAVLGGTAANPFIEDGSAAIEFQPTAFTRGLRAVSPSTTVPAGAASTALSQAITGLQPATTYNYRVIAFNGDGVAFSPSFTFTTKPLPVVAPVSKCASRRNFPIRLPKIPKRYRSHKVQRATVKLGSKTLAVVTGSRLKSKVNLKNLPKGTFTLKITMRLSGGLVARQSRTYHTCSLKLEHVPRPPKISSRR